MKTVIDRIFPRKLPSVVYCGSKAINKQIFFRNEGLGLIMFITTAVMRIIEKFHLAGDSSPFSLLKGKRIEDIPMQNVLMIS